MDFISREQHILCLFFQPRNKIFVFQVDRAIKNVTVVEQKVKKDFSFQENILDLCLGCLDMETVPEPVVS